MYYNARTHTLSIHTYTHTLHIYINMHMGAHTHTHTQRAELDRVPFYFMNFSPTVTSNMCRGT